MNFSDKYLADMDPQDLRNIVRSLEVQVETMQQKLLELLQLNGVSGDLGEVTAGGIITPAPESESIEPTDAAFTGSFLTSQGRAFGGDQYNIGSSAAGVLQWGANIKGKLIAGQGNVSLDENGINLTSGADLIVNQWVALGLPSDSITQSVQACAYDSANNKLYVGGTFTIIGGLPANYIARWNFNSMDWELVGSGTDLSGAVNALLIDGDSLYVGGSFTNAHGLTSADYIVKYTISTGQWTSMGGNFNSTVTSLAIHGDHLFAGGGWTTALGAVASYIAKYTISTNTWSSIGGSINSIVYALSIGNDMLYVGGNFTNADGIATADYIAVYSIIGNTWSSIGGQLNARVYAISIIGDTMIIGGLFTNADGIATADYIAVYSIIGNTWSSITPDFQIDSSGAYVYSIAANGDRLIIGGKFTDFGIASRNYIAEYNLTTGVWSSVDVTFDNNVFAVLFFGDNIAVGGGFDTTNGLSARMIAVKLVELDALLKFYNAQTVHLLDNVVTLNSHLHAVFADTTTTRFGAKNFSDTVSQSYLEQYIQVFRAMRIKEFLLDVYKAGDYTITLRDYENNVLKSITVTGIADATLAVVFAADDFLVTPGLYRIHVASTVSRLYYLYNLVGMQIHSELQTTGYIPLGGYTNYHVPIQWVFYPQVDAEGLPETDIADAPSDGNYYGRRDAAWANLQTFFDTLYASIAHTHAQLHDRSHALDSTSDHSIGGLTNGYLVKSDGSKLTPSANTDADVSSAVSLKHDAITLDVNADALFSLAAQVIGLDTQLANLVLASPTTGAAAVPTFRSLVEADIPSLSAYIQAALLTTRGDLLYRNATIPARLGISGVVGSVLSRDANDPVWSAYGFIGSAAAVYTLPSVTATLAGLAVAQIFTAAQTINVNSALALLVEQTGVKNNVLAVDTTNGRVGINKAPTAIFDLVGAHTSTVPVWRVKTTSTTTGRVGEILDVSDNVIFSWDKNNNFNLPYSTSYILFGVAGSGSQLEVKKSGFTLSSGVTDFGTLNSGTTRSGSAAMQLEGVTGRPLQLGKTNGIEAGAFLTTLASETPLKARGATSQSVPVEIHQDSSLVTHNQFSINAGGENVINEQGLDIDTRIESDTESNMFVVDAAENAVYIGGRTNGIKILKSGEMSFLGTATVWQDIDFPILIRTTGANIPTLTTLNGNITMPQWAVNDFNVCESQEFVHQWKEESACYWHIHLTTNGLDATNRYVRFEVEYGYVTPSGVWNFPATIDSGDLLIPANTTDKTMFILSLGNFTPAAGTKIGGHVVARLKRIAATGTAPSNNPWVPMLQMHIECDTLGSKEIATK
jgi:hypothetical protein